MPFYSEEDFERDRVQEEEEEEEEGTAYNKQQKNDRRMDELDREMVYTKKKILCTGHAEEYCLRTAF